MNSCMTLQNTQLTVSVAYDPTPMAYRSLVSLITRYRSGTWGVPVGYPFDTGQGGYDPYPLLSTAQHWTWYRSDDPGQTLQA